MRTALAFLGLLTATALACGQSSRVAEQAPEAKDPTATRTAEPSHTNTLQPSATNTIAPTHTPTMPPPTATAIEGETALVVRIIDGDTIDVEIDGETFRVRYIGIDTPESGDACSQDATIANSELVFQQTVTMVKDTSETDRFDRLLRYVYVGEVFVNAELVGRGYANSARYPPDTKYAALFDTLASQAKSEGMGCWNNGVFASSPEPVALAPSATSQPAQANTPVPSTPPSATPASAVAPTQPPTAVPSATAAPIGGYVCAGGEACIKGNINSDGVKIYHYPGCASYNRTKIDPSKGERWFTTSSEAEAAGWRVAGNC